MLTKPIYTSKTIIGVVVLALSWAAERWGLPVTEGDLTEAATLILGAVGAVLAVYGRLSATKSISSSGSGNHLPALLLAVSVAVLTSGCALRDLSAQDKALAVGEELRLVYLEMHNAYLAVEPTLPADKAQVLRSTVAPAMDKARRAIVTLRALAATWAEVGAQPADWTRAKADALLALGDAWRLLNDFYDTAGVSALAGVEVTQ